MPTPHSHSANFDAVKTDEAGCPSSLRWAAASSRSAAVLPRLTCLSLGPVVFSKIALAEERKLAEARLFLSPPPPSPPRRHSVPSQSPTAGLGESGRQMKERRNEVARQKRGWEKGMEGWREKESKGERGASGIIRASGIGGGVEG